MDATQIGTLIVALTGLVTAFTAIYKTRNEANMKSREHQVTATSVLDERHQVIYDTIQTNVVEPVVKRADRLSEENRDLRQEIVTLRKEVSLVESKLQIGVVYIRELLEHIKEMAYPGDPPTPPSGLDL